MSELESNFHSQHLAANPHPPLGSMDFPVLSPSPEPAAYRRALTSSEHLSQLQLREQENKCLFVFGPPSTSGLIDAIIDQDPILMQRGAIKWAEFEDGMPNLLIEHVDIVQGRDVVFIADFLNLRELLNQLSVLYAMPRYIIRSFTVVLAYFPTGTMERVEYEGQIATAYTLAKIISAIPLTLSGPAKVVIYDIHALQERFYFTENVVPVLVSAIPLFLETLKRHHGDEKIAIAFPDEGAQKRFGRDFSGFPQIICSKVREGEKRVVKIKEGEPAGMHVFIVDDLVKTGGTLIECKQVLLSNNAAAVSAFVTHAVFPQESYKRFTKRGPSEFQRFYVTDSCPTVSRVLQGTAPFEVLSLAKSIASIVLRLC